MKKIILFFTIILSVQVFSFAHSTIKGKVSNRTSRESLGGAIVQLVENNKTLITDINGNFEFKGLASGKYTLRFSLVGYKTKIDTLQIKNNESVSITVLLEEHILELEQITITPQKELGYSSISAIDLKLRPHNSTQDLLRIVPGLFIAQHAGGGKSEQIFLRGFDIDHGTDINLSVDGMPVNMVSHAHGQGYADLHFIIPETIDKINFSKGPYDAKVGDFATAGAVQFKTLNYLPQNMFKLEAGRFDTYRGVTMLNLLNNSDSVQRNHNAYVAAEYMFTNGYFESPQDFDRINLFGKYSGSINSTTDLSFSLSSFMSKWDASGQIPERAVRAGTISRFGSIDDSEGGRTSRHNANLTLTKTLSNDAILKSNLYYVRNNFGLFSNFTFFKDDSINGDEIFQSEARNIIGYNASYTKNISIGNKDFKTSIGGGLRDDKIYDISLSRAKKRILLNDFKRGDIYETNVNIYLDETVALSENLNINLGIRYDHFRFRYLSKLGDTIRKPKTDGVFSPKFNIYYTPARNIQLFFNSGMGFHSNDARVVTAQTEENTLPKAYGMEIGTNLKIIKKIFINTSLWFLDLQSEFVYVGDEGFVEPSGPSRRIGIDLSMRYQILKWLFADVDFNVANPRFIEEPEGEDQVPLAPRISSIGGLTIKSPAGINGSLRYRYLGDRPAIEDNSIVAEGYFIMDAVLNYSKPKYQIGVSVENIFNVKWKEAQFATESRLLNEPAPVNEIHYTPGTPFFIKGNIVYFF